MGEGAYVESLIDEYESLLAQVPLNDNRREYDKSEILKNLAGSSDWSFAAARELVMLAEYYGAFMLRNALAIAVVLGKEDGLKGF